LLKRDYPPRVPVPEGKLEGCYVYEIVVKKGGPRLFCRILGWHTLVPINARTVMPPLKQKPVYGPAAKRWAHSIPHTIRKPWEHSVNCGKSPLHLRYYQRREKDLMRYRAKKERESQPQPLARIELTNGLRIVR